MEPLLKGEGIVQLASLLKTACIVKNLNKKGGSSKRTSLLQLKVLGWKQGTLIEGRRHCTVSLLVKTACIVKHLK